MSSSSYSINSEKDSGQKDPLEANLSSLAKNMIIFDCDELEPVVERVKLEGDEYATGKKHLDKRDVAAGASMEIFKSLECLPLE